MDLSYGVLAVGLAWYIVFVVSTSFHEAAHALAAWKLGDSTAYHGGQVTLNPLPHIQREPVGMLVVPAVSYLLGGFLIGWASAPYDPSWARRYPRRAALMAAAGPAANLLLVLVSGLLIRAGVGAGVFEAPERMQSITEFVGGAEGFTGGLAAVLSLFFLLNLLLAVFNLLPLPPLDGSAVAMLLLPASAARKYQELLSEPVFSLLGIVVAWKLFAELSVFPKLLRLALRLMYPDVWM